MPSLTRIARLGLVALALPLLTAACEGDDAPDGRTPLAELPGVRDVFVGDVEVEDGVEERAVVVDADPDASAEQLSDVLEAMGRSDPEISRLYLGAGSTDWALPFGDPTSRVSGGPDPQLHADRTAELLLAGAAVGTADVDAASGEVQLTLDGDADLATTAARAVVQDAALSGVPVRISAYAEDAGRAVPVATLASDTTLTADLVDVWAGLLASARGLESPTLAYPSVVSRGDGALLVLLGLEFAEDVTPADVTTATYGDVLWPVVRPLLDRLRTSPPGSQVQLARQTPDRSVFDVFLDVGVGPDGAVAAAPDPGGRTWGEEALAG